MEPETATQKANRRLREIWREALKSGQWPRGILHLWPLQYPEMTSRKLLFVGLNPSNSSDSKLLTLAPDETDLESTDRARDILHREERVMGMHGGKLHKYFGQFHRFQGPDNWNHVDLLAVRHTNQSELAGALALRAHDAFQNGFVAAQIEVCLELSASLEPQAVVVVNALASEILHEWLTKTKDLAFDSKVGYHLANLGSRKVPWFFSGMLTGQRALDTFSLKRLIWHVQCALHPEAVG
jgi:hypothetical protein